MGTRRQIRVTLLLAALGAGCMSAAGQTVRHHKIAQPDPSFPPELIQAESDIEKKDYAAAEPLLKKVVADDPKNYQAWFDLGFVYNAQGNLTESIAAYRKSVAAKPDVFESNLNLGISLAKAGQPDAEQFLRAATTLKPTANVDEGRARAWLSLAHVLEASKPEEAIAAYQRAATLTPKDPEPHLAAGTLLVKAYHFADAEQEYKQALTIDPASSEALIGLANIYTRGNRFLDAQQVLEKIVALHPDDTQARLLLSRVLVQMGKNDEAVASAQAASKLDPMNPKIQRELADLYMSAKKYDQAEAVYRSLLNGKTDNPADLHHVLGVALLKQRKFPEAEQECLAAVKLKPDLGEAYGDLAVAAVENKDYQLAIKAADARAKFLPEIPIGYFLRASAYDHLRAYKPAAENYHKFLEVANGQYPDQEWQARHRLIAIEPKK
ncbi:Tetratricopeptide repeat protein [Candidatus Sulfotelmatobacter sp. SbA7]|jgi:tetratricopeptide (TPR) repeat protein|nr:Tetratricopeptide repeat protein [Candidatus Sulfotelmatobacter sp. SbA7]